MSSRRAVEWLLPSLSEHLGGPLAFPPPADAHAEPTSATATAPHASSTRSSHHNQNDQQTNKTTAAGITAADRAAPCPSLCSSYLPLNAEATHIAETLVESARRWQHCFLIWRKVLGSDVLLLALLHHSGCLWGPQYDALQAAVGDTLAEHESQLRMNGGTGENVVDGTAAVKEATAAKLLQGLRARQPHSLWALNVLHFLGLYEVFESTGMEKAPRDSPRPQKPSPSSRSPSPQEQDHRDEKRRDGDRMHPHSSHRHSRSYSRHAKDRRKRSRHRRGSHPARAGRRARSPRLHSGAHSPSLECSAGILQDLLPAPFANVGTVGAAAAAALSAASLLGGGKSHTRGPGATHASPCNNSMAAKGPGSSATAASDALSTAAIRAGGVTAGGGATGKETPVISLEEQQRLLCTACVTVTHMDEPLVQRTAAWLVDEWIALFSIPADAETITTTTATADDGVPAANASEDVSRKRKWETHTCIIRARRHYWLSAALKFAAYTDGTHSALREENAHVQALVARQAIPEETVGELLQRSLPSILCCLLRDEVSTPSTCSIDANDISYEDGNDTQVGSTGLPLLVPRELCLPPPVYFLPFHTLGRGSRVAVWLPGEALGTDRGAFDLFHVSSGGIEIDLGGVEGLSLRLCWRGNGASGGRAYGVHGGNGSGGNHNSNSERRAAWDRLLPLCARGRHRIARKNDEDDNRSASREDCEGDDDASDEGGYSSADESTHRRLNTHRDGFTDSRTRRWSATTQELLGHLCVEHYAPRIIFMRPIPARDPSRAGTWNKYPSPQTSTAPIITSASSTIANGGGGEGGTRRKRAGGTYGGGPEVLLTLLSGVYPAPAADVLALMQRRLQHTKLTLSHQHGIGVSGSCGGASSGGASTGNTSVGGGGIAGSRQTLARDPLGTTLQLAFVTARRLLALRGACVTLPSTETAIGTAAVDTDYAGLERRAAASSASAESQSPSPPRGVGKSVGKGVRHTTGGCSRATSQCNTSSSTGAPAPWLGWSFRSADAELEALAECATSLALLVLLHAHSLPEALREQPAAALWLTEVASLVADIAVSTCAPVHRLLRAAGFALCVMPPRAQSLLVAVGLYASLGTRQWQCLQNGPQQARSGGGRRRPTRTAVSGRGKTRGDGGGGEVHLWWSIFRRVVLEDAWVPAQLHPTTWVLADSVDAAMQRAAEQHARSWAAGVLGEDGQIGGDSDPLNASAPATPRAGASTTRRTLRLRRPSAAMASGAASPARTSASSQPSQPHSSSRLALRMRKDVVPRSSFTRDGETGDGIVSSTSSVPNTFATGTNAGGISPDGSRREVHTVRGEGVVRHTVPEATLTHTVGAADAQDAEEVSRAAASSLWSSIERSLRAFLLSPV